MSRSLRVASRRQRLHNFEQERAQFNKDLSKARIMHKEDYWNTQTQVENEYLRKFRNERIKKQADDMTRWRTQICNISLMTQKKMVKL